MNVTRRNKNGRWGLGSAYKYLGCIYNPAVKDEPKPAPAKLKYNVGDKVVINGNLYVSSTAASASGTVKNKVTTITRVAPGTAHPYNTTGDLGWMNEKDIKKYTEPAKPATKPSSGFKEGDKVKIIGKGNGQADGKGQVAYGIGYVRYITKIYSKSAYPYQVGNKGKTDGANTLGFYKANALRKL